MPGAERAEIYFITAMMILILVLCVAAVFLFFRQNKKETRERDEAKRTKDTERAAKSDTAP